MEWPIGTRVTIRRRLPDGFSDVVGVLLSADSGGVVVRNRHDEVVEIPAEIIAVGRVVGERPRRGFKAE